MGFNEVMILTSSIPPEMSFAPSMGLLFGTLGALCAAACGVLAASPLLKKRAPRLRVVRLTEAPALG